MRVVFQRRISFIIIIYKIFGKNFGDTGMVFSYKPRNVFILTAMSNVMIISRGSILFSWWLIIGIVLRMLSPTRGLLGVLLSLKSHMILIV